MEDHHLSATVAALVAAAGMSRRMGAPKQLLPWGDQTVIAQVVQNLHAAGADPVICVTGHRHAEVSQALIGTPAHIVFNPDYATGEMLSSYQAGLQTLRERACIGVLIALGDQPHIPVAVVAQVIAQAAATPDNLVIPSYAMRRGHPFYIPRRLWAALLALGPSETLRTLITQHTDTIRYVTVETDAILRDMDTPTDFAALKGKA
jgi:molybdenum cofactor cytidylyltransferase